MGDVGPAHVLAAIRRRAALDIATAERRLREAAEARTGTNADDEHDPEGSTLAFELAQEDAVLAAARRRITEVDDALRRVEDGSYGTCSVCGRLIPPQRLEARPSTDRCVPHA